MPPEFFRQAEEYDLSFRLWQEGYRIDRFEDVVYRHDKVAGNRDAGEIHRMDMRNNLIVLARYLPSPLHNEYRHDWVQRYHLIARHAGHEHAALLGRSQARGWRLRERLAGRPLLVERAVESIFELERQAEAIARWAQHLAIRRVIIADFSKNLFATYRACRLAGLSISSIADNNPAFIGQRYRSIPIEADASSQHHRCDGVILSTTNPARVESRLSELAQCFSVPILRLWQPVMLGEEQPVRGSLPLSLRERVAGTPAG